MNKFECDKCGKKLANKNSYNNHVNRKTSCIKIDKFVCKVCGKYFTRKYNLNRHEKNCIKKTNAVKFLCSSCDRFFVRKYNLDRHINTVHQCISNNNDVIFKEINFLKDQMKIKDIEINELKKFRDLANEYNISNNSNNTNNINNKTVNQNNIIVNPFGKEDLSYISDEIYKKIINKGFQSVPTLVNLIHFNEKRPQNHNIYISNIRSNHILLYDGISWAIHDQKTIINNLYEDNLNILELKFEQLDNIDRKAKIKFERFLNKKDDNEEVNIIKNDLKMNLYNRRKYIMDSQN